MINEYLEKKHGELRKEKHALKEELRRIQIHIKENRKFIELLEQSEDPDIESFSPRAGNSKDKEKIKELQEEQKRLLQEEEEKQQALDVCRENEKELAAVKKEVQTEKSAGNAEKYRLKILEAQENERQRIARELHDTTVQDMTSLIHKTELCMKLVDLDPSRCKLELNVVSKILRETVNEARNNIYNLRPMSFDDIGLDVTIQRLIEKLETTTSKKISFFMKGTPYPIQSVIGITLVRIIQEACVNAIKHADPSLIKVVLQYEPKRILIQIENDGKGFDSEKEMSVQKKDNSGFGLSIMKERVYLLSGTIRIVSKINSGTKIFVEVPITE